MGGDWVTAVGGDKMTAADGERVTAVGETSGISVDDSRGRQQWVESE